MQLHFPPSLFETLTLPGSGKQFNQCQLNSVISDLNAVSSGFCHVPLQVSSLVPEASVASRGSAEPRLPASVFTCLLDELTLPHWYLLLNPCLFSVALSPHALCPPHPAQEALQNHSSLSGTFHGLLESVGRPADPSLP